MYFQGLVDGTLSGNERITVEWFWSGGVPRYDQ